jgi:hypothetical protein
MDDQTKHQGVAMFTAIRDLFRKPSATPESGVVDYSDIQGRFTFDVFLHPDGSTTTATRDYGNHIGYWDGPGPEEFVFPAGTFDGLADAMSEVLAAGCLIIDERRACNNRYGNSDTHHPELPALDYSSQRGMEGVWGFHVAEAA